MAASRPAHPPLAAIDGFGSYTPAPARPRLESVDLLRGLVMVLMLIDHTRDFAHVDALRFDPADMARTTAPLFLTRWVTHFCAPIFVLLAGTGAYLQRLRGATTSELGRFLVKRGLWLVLLEFTVVRIFTWFNFDYRFLGLAQVIWAIGVSMIVLAALIRLPLRAVAAFGIAMVALHNLLGPVDALVTRWAGPGTPQPGVLGSLWTLLHIGQAVLPVGPFPAPVVFALYPLIPWMGVMALGYALGAVYEWDGERRQRFLARAGLACIALFLALRAVNYAGLGYGLAGEHGYGDPRPWAVQRSAVMTVMSFLNVTKYPPSLLFLLMTLGPAMIALAWFERTRRGPVGEALVTFGRVPLFYYLLQWLVAHGLAVLAGVAAGQPVAYQALNPFDKPNPPPPGIGFSLGVVYALWALGLVILYPLCRWYAGLKRRRRDWWLSYL